MPSTNQNDDTVLDDTVLDDTVLIQACVAGQQPAWEEFVLRYGRLIACTAANTRRRLPVPVCDVEDLTGFVYERLLDDSCRRLRLWRGHCKFSTYLVVVTQNLCRDYLDKHGEVRRVNPWHELPDWLRRCLHPQQDLDRQFRLEALEEAISQLHARQAMVIRLRIQGKTLREIAEIIRVPEGTVFSLNKRAIASLRELMPSDDQSERGT